MSIVYNGDKRNEEAAKCEKTKHDAIALASEIII